MHSSEVHTSYITRIRRYVDYLVIQLHLHATYRKTYLGLELAKFSFL